MHEFFAMGGYAFYVWMSFGLTFVVMVANCWLAARRHAATLRQIRRQLDTSDPLGPATVKEVVA
ncbi:MAG: heme exporter protein CcmD [Pseudomonadota bacterium]